MLLFLGAITFTIRTGVMRYDTLVVNEQEIDHELNEETNNGFMVTEF